MFLLLVNFYLGRFKLRPPSVAGVGSALSSSVVDNISYIYITLTTNPHENVILGYNDIMFKTKSILRELSRPFRLPHSVVLAVEETVDV